MKSKLFSILFLLLSASYCSAQNLEDLITHVSFSFAHSLRIPYNKVHIKIIKRQNETEVLVRSEAMNNDKTWAYSVIDTSFLIDKEIFEGLSHELSFLTQMDLRRPFLIDAGLDGTTCVIEFGCYGNTVSYKFWTPDSGTAPRGLTKFLELCKEIIRIGGLDPDEIL